MRGGERALRFGRVESFALVALAYLLALAVALEIAAAAQPASLAVLFAADLAATAVIFACSMALDNGSVYDPYWSVAPPLIAWYWLAHASDASALRQGMVTVAVCAWAARLTFNWVRGWPGLHHEDWRYLELYTRAPKWLVSLAGIHLFPTVQVFLGCLALAPALAYGDAPFGVLDLVALVISGAAIAVELVADEQLHRFRGRATPGEILTAGVWSWSRHPNYFGELSFWWGLYLFGLAADAAWWWTIVGPLTMTAMFLFVSIPMLDRRSLARRPGYAAHMQRVNALIPWPPRRAP
jgi:steroid 5-alpha reductase family enzyme